MYLLSYFTAAEEALHLATSVDGFEFEPVGGGAPILRGEVGTRTLRDPFIGLGPGGDYHLLATDGWHSPHIVHAVTSDLRAWSRQRLLPVMNDIPGARNAWAPEFFTDPATGLFHLIWSSVVDDGFQERDWRETAQEQRIWHTTTANFADFAPSSRFFDPGHTVIDATVGVAGDRFVMAYKDERGENDVDTAHKHIMLTTFERPGGPFSPPVGPVSPSPVEGPSLFRRGEEWVLIFDHFLEGRYGALATRDLTDHTTWEPADLVLPAGIRHASVARLP